MQPPVPTDRPVYEGSIATYWFEGDVLVSLSKSNLRTVELIKENVAFVKQITGGKRVPLLIYLTKSPMPDKATRKFSSQMVPEIYSAMAMIAPSGLATFIMKMVFALQQPPIPMRSFTDANAAMVWLRSLGTSKSNT